MKSPLEELNSRSEQAEKESAILRIISWDYPVWGTERKKNDGKWTEPMRHHQIHQHTHNRSLRWRRKRDGPERIFKDIMTQTPQIWWKLWISTSNKLKKSEVGQTQRDPHVDPSASNWQKPEWESWKQQERSNSIHTMDPQQC